MDAEHAKIWVQPPPAPIQNTDRLVDQPSPVYEHEKIASDDLLLMGMMLWMEQGLVLEWLHPATEKEDEEENQEENPGGDPPD
jgi:hypothetical protein